MKQIDRLLKDALIKNHLLSEEDFARYADRIEEKQTLREFLIINNIVNERQMLIAFSQSLELEFVDLKNIDIEPGVIESIPVKFAWYYKFLPIKIERSTLTVACSHPFDVATQDELRMHLGYDVRVVLTMQKELNEALKRYYGFASHTIDKIMAREDTPANEGVVDNGQWVEEIDQQTEDPTVSHLVNEIILEAYEKRATDIHIEPYRNKVRFRYRIDGVLVDANLPDKVRHFLPQILSRIKILANLSITEKRLPQDGSAVVRTKEQHLDLRISTMPTPRGESIVIRILPTKVILFSLEKLGFNQKSVYKFRELVKKPHGVIFMTGPTGSGKTTTLYACLNEINSPERKIITIEDPVEYEMEGITQVQINTKVNFDFAKGLRSILRHDPDIVMVGEVRDLETAEIAIRTALTGHLVFSTLHTNDAASGITRLIDMGVEPYLVASSVEAFVAQRLVRLICPKCKEEVDTPDAIKKEIQESLKLKKVDQVKVYQGKGCDHCNNTGYYGRMAIYEILTLNDTIRALMLEKPRSDYLKRIAMKEGLVTLRQSAWKAVVDGMTTVREVLNVTVRDEALSDVQNLALLESAESLQAQPKNEIVTYELPNLDKQDDYEARVYARTLESVNITYRIVRKDEKNANTFISEGPQRQAKTKDLSAGGLRFISGYLLAVGTILELTVFLEDSKTKIPCLAKVSRVQEDSLNNTYTVTAYYFDISDNDRKSIDSFVKQRINQHC